MYEHPDVPGQIVVPWVKKMQSFRNDLNSSIKIRVVGIVHKHTHQSEALQWGSSLSRLAFARAWQVRIEAAVVNTDRQAVAPPEAAEQVPTGGIYAAARLPFDPCCCCCSANLRMSVVAAQFHCMAPHLAVLLGTLSANTRQGITLTLVHYAGLRAKNKDSNAIILVHKRPGFIRLWNSSEWVFQKMSHSISFYASFRC